MNNYGSSASNYRFWSRFRGLARIKILKAVAFMQIVDSDLLEHFEDCQEATCQFGYLW